MPLCPTSYLCHGWLLSLLVILQNEIIYDLIIYLLRAEIILQLPSAEVTIGVCLLSTAFLSPHFNVLGCQLRKHSCPSEPLSSVRFELCYFRCSLLDLHREVCCKITIGCLHREICKPPLQFCSFLPMIL